MDWKEDLNNIKKEKKYGLHNRRNNNSNNSGIATRSSNNSPYLKNKGGKQMITIDAAISDVDKLIKEANDDKSTILILKAYKIVLKFLSTMRSNQLLTEESKKRINASRNKRIKDKVEEEKK